MQNGFDSILVYNEKILKTKLKSCGGSINIDFNCDKVSKEDSLCICQSVIVIDYVYKMNKNYYPQVFLEECKCKLKEKQITRYITEDIGIFSSSDDDDDSKDSEEDSE